MAQLRPSTFDPDIGPRKTENETPGRMRGNLRIVRGKESMASVKSNDISEEERRAAGYEDPTQLSTTDGQNSLPEDEPVQEDGPDEDIDDDDGGHGDTTLSRNATYEPKPPARSPAPALFKAWRQDSYGTMMMQAVIQDDAEALVWMLKHNLVELEATDDLGNTAAHLAVFHDSPRVLRLLHELGLDLSATCDAEEFGSAIFYSVYLGRVECLEELIALGYDMFPPCDRFGRTPEVVAERHDQGAALAMVRRSLACLDIQRLARGFLGRRKAVRIKAAWGRAAKKQEEEEAAGNNPGSVGEDGADAAAVEGSDGSGEGGDDDGDQ
eukprot:g16664.t1